MKPCKYPINVLREMARHVLKAKQSGDERYMQFVTTFAVRTEITPDQAEAHIRKLAL